MTSNAGTLSLGGGLSKFLTGSTNALTSLQSNSGSLYLNQSLAVTPAFSNSGSVTIQAGTFTTHPFTQTAGTTTVVGGATLQSGSGTSSVTISGGTLTGTGQIKGNLLGTGNVAPVGTVSGPMTVNGTYTDSAGTLTIPTSGTNAAGVDFGQLSATGTATLGGTLTLATAGGYLPPIATTYTILKAVSISGTFATVNGTRLAGRQYVLTHSPTTVTATVQALPPAVSGVSPTSGPAGGGTSVTITGTDLTGATSVSFGAMAASSYTVNSNTQITATAPAGTGTVHVTVTTPGGTSTTNNSDQFTCQSGGPTVTSVSPSAGPTTGGTSVTIAGTGFASDASVKFGATAATVTSVNGTQITATAPSQPAPGTVDVTVTASAGTSAVSFADQYTYMARPAVTSVSPDAGPIAGGTSVTITGTGFVAGATVKFGSTGSSPVTVQSATQLTVLAPGHATGSVDVTVTTPAAPVRPRRRTSTPTTRHRRSPARASSPASPRASGRWRLQR